MLSTAFGLIFSNYIQYLISSCLISLLPWRKYRIVIHSELIRTIPIHSDIPNESEKCFISRLMKIGQKPIRLNPINFETSIRMNPNESEPIRNQVFNLVQSELIRSRIYLNRIFNQNQSKSFWP